jgi:hypothetical protein
MTIATYNQVLLMAQQLEPNEQIKLLKALINVIPSDVEHSTKAKSVFELQGLGKEVWNKVDVDAYIKEERASWDG